MSLPVPTRLKAKAPENKHWTPVIDYSSSAACLTTKTDGNSSFSLFTSFNYYYWMRY